VRRARRVIPRVALTKARLKLMLREPEMVFWVFVFPILMALSLGIAFENQSDELMPVGVRVGDGDHGVMAQLEHTGDLSPFRVTPEEELTVLRDGRAHVVVVPGSPPTYRLDPARPERAVGRGSSSIGPSRAARARGGRRQRRSRLPAADILTGWSRGCSG
jgi:ABC-2 type transport system permease protein